MTSGVTKAKTQQRSSEPILNDIDWATLAAATAAVIGRYLGREKVVLGVEAEDLGHLVRLTILPGHDRPVGEIAREIESMVSGEAKPTPQESTDPAGIDCILTFDRTTGGGEPTLSFDASHIDPWRMDVLLASTTEAANAAAEDRALAAPALPLVSESMRAKLLSEANGASHPLPPRATVVDLIDAQVAARPQKQACLFAERSLSYEELDFRAASLAAALEVQGTRRGDVVAVLVGNSLELPVSLLACLRLGAIFVPMDEAWPEERLKLLLRHADPRAIIARNASHVPPGFGDRLVRCSAAARRKPAQDHREEILQTDVAYGFPTSGSTGPPKCALNVHRGLLNRFLYMTRRFASGPNEVVLQNSRHVFDSSLWQLLWPLTNGATVVIPTPAKHLDLEQTIELIERHRVTMTDFVPSVFNALVHHLDRNPDDVVRLSSLRHLLIGGEEINPRSCHQFNAMLSNVSLTNTYGPTEASIGMVFHQVNPEDGDRVPIGRPIDNTHAVVCDEHGWLVPPGMIGELYIGGACLGTGYLGDAKRTADAWVTNPFSELAGDQLYRTGDLVYQEPDGKLYFVGRADKQVKLGGVRVELGEVEHALMGHSSVDRAIVCAERVATTHPTTHHLVAYVISRDEVAEEDLESHLSRLLPKQMVPRRFVFLDEIPLTHNGKLDRKRLEAMANSPPPLFSGETPEQATLRAVWRRLLGRADFTLDDDFFMLGGDSLLVVHLVLEIEDRFGKRLSLRAAYEAPTIRRLAAVLSDNGASAPRSSTASDLRLAERDIGSLDGLASLSAEKATAHRLERILMTGASGFVGAHVLAELLERTDIEVLFLARDRQPDAALERLQKVLADYRLWTDSFEERLAPVAGDLGSSRLGLADRDWDELASTADLILNCAGEVNFLHDYRHHQPANVEGLARVLGLAFEGTPARIHHLSSLGVADASDPPGDGYNLSKWAAERLVEKARSRGLATTVHRLGEAMPHSLTGIPNRRSLSYLLIRSCLTLGLYPEGLVSFDYSPADWVAKAIVDSVLERDATPETELAHPLGSTLDDVMASAAAIGLGASPVGGRDFHRALISRCEWDGNRSLQTLRCLLVAAQDRQGDADVDAALSGLFAAPTRATRATDAPSAPARWPGSRWAEIDADLLVPMLRETAPHPTLGAFTPADRQDARRSHSRRREEAVGSRRSPQRRCPPR